MPDNNRMVVFLLMMMMSASHVLLKVVACSLLLRLSRVWFLLYVVGDTILFLFYKILRGELRYSLRLFGFFSWFVSFAARIVNKNTADFTLIVQYRHSMELGGIYWTVNMIANQTVCFVSVYLFNKYSEKQNEEEEGQNMIIQNLWLIVSGLLLLSMLNFATFMVLIKKEYRHTFYSTISGKTSHCDRWRNAKTDKEKINVFNTHRSYYKSIDKNLREWLFENWGNGSPRIGLLQSKSKRSRAIYFQRRR